MSTAKRAELTLARVWESLASAPISDDLLEWPPDVFALSRGSTGVNASPKTRLASENGNSYRAGAGRPTTRRALARRESPECGEGLAPWPVAQAVERDPGYVLDLLGIAGWELADPDDRVEEVVAAANAQRPPLTIERGTSSSG
jgi:hypothetical protein